MLQISTEQYLEGMASLKYFSDMLEYCLRRELPGVGLKRVSAFGWRGFQIIKFPGLKDRHYFCQIHTHNPHILSFYEYFDMSHYLCRRDIDLLERDFYNLDSEGQQQFLSSFIHDALQAALIWNASEQRRRDVPQKYW